MTVIDALVGQHHDRDEGRHLSFPIESKVKNFVGETVADHLGADIG